MLVSKSVRQAVGFLGYWSGSRKNGRFVPCGTAFAVANATRGKLFSHLVTAQHVIVGIQAKTDQVVWRFNKKDGEYAYGALPLNGWYYHPDATRFVDIAVAPVKTPEVADLAFINLGTESATDKVIENESIGPGDEVFLSGFFRYHYGTQKNIPIIRMGNIAAMPEEPIATKSGPMNGYLIEARSIGGLSGSPVFVRMQPWRVVEGTVRQHQGPVHYPLGVMHGHYDVKMNAESTDDWISDDDRLQAERLNVGIGIACPVQQLLETIMQPELERERLRLVENLKEDEE